MYKRILIPTDGSELAMKAVEAGLQLAAETGARVTVITVTEPFHTLSFAPSQVTDTPATYKKHAREHAKRILDEAQGKAAAAGVPCDTVWMEHEYPHEAIIDAANSRQCDLITMASHGRRGVSALLLGSETVKVLTHSRLPVLVFR